MIERYEKKEISEIWTQEYKFKKFLDVEVALLKALEKRDMKKIMIINHKDQINLITLILRIYQQHLKLVHNKQTNLYKHQIKKDKEKIV